MYRTFQAEVGSVLQLLFRLKRHGPTALEKDLGVVGVYPIETANIERNSWVFSRHSLLVCARFPCRPIPRPQTLALQIQETAPCSPTPLGQRACCQRVVTDTLRTLHRKVQPTCISYFSLWLHRVNEKRRRDIVFSKLPKATVRFVMCVCTPAWNNSATTVRIFVKLYI